MIRFGSVENRGGDFHENRSVVMSCASVVKVGVPSARANTNSRVEMLEVQALLKLRSRVLRASTSSARTT